MKQKPGFSNEFSISSIERMERVLLGKKEADLLSILIQFLFYEMKRIRRSKMK
jgi:hypothetical protein